MQPSSLRVGRIRAVNSACRSGSWPGLACIMTTRATASLGSFPAFCERDPDDLRAGGDFRFAFVERRAGLRCLRLAMARDCTPRCLLMEINKPKSKIYDSAAGAVLSHASLFYSSADFLCESGLSGANNDRVWSKVFPPTSL